MGEVVVLMGVLATTPSPTDAPEDAWWEDVVAEVMDKRYRKQMKRRRKARNAEEKNRMVVEGSAKKGLGQCFAKGVWIPSARIAKDGSSSRRWLQRRQIFNGEMLFSRCNRLFLLASGDASTLGASYLENEHGVPFLIHSYLLKQ